MTKKPLTDKQQEVLNFIKSHIEDHGHSPSWEDIAKRFDTGVTNVRRYISFLEKKGHIQKDNSTRPPSISIL